METKQDIMLSPALNEICLGNSNEGGNKIVPQNVRKDADNVNFAVTAMLDVIRLNGMSVATRYQHNR